MNYKHTLTYMSTSKYFPFFDCQDLHGSTQKFVNHIRCTNMQKFDSVVPNLNSFPWWQLCILSDGHELGVSKLDEGAQLFQH